MTSDNWADALAALKASMPQDDTPAADTPADSPADKSAPSQRTATICYERKGRGGRPATIVYDITGCDDSDVASLASDIKKALATGGSVRDREILLLGDCRERLRKFLSSKGFKVKG